MLFNDRWKLLSRAASPGGTRVAELSPSQRHFQAPSRGLDRRAHAQGDVYSRHSNGLEQFFSQIQGLTGLRILDLSGASQANVGFITGLGHAIYSEDVLKSLDLAFGDGDFFQNQSDPERTERFLSQNFDFPENHFDGVLAWDSLEYFTPALLNQVVERLSRALRPGGYLLAMFHTEERADSIPAYYYRISDARTLLLTFREMRKPAQFFNNRAVERLFSSFESVKFFLTRDALREVIVKR
ncbi:MAG TPA: class I SAM-dependent methyltransferase [Bryobacteraceae bacterium]|nr:class I SAM-dependent methyltransferase [Bryobacteraceae bacterium]HPQ14409.1 class I SAM-dependent methyltransferase [Bryobacteraceae bacterium]HPU73329.1 class I SAM-dependent methyltransferase [Bryobacteraceae bacterium]